MYNDNIIIENPTIERIRQDYRVVYGAPYEATDIVSGKRFIVRNRIVIKKDISKPNVLYLYIVQR